METQTVYTFNQQAVRATRIEERFHQTLHKFVRKGISEPVESLQFILNDFTLLSEGYNRDYILDSIGEINRIVEFLTGLYDELENYSKGRSTDEIFPTSLTNTYLICKEFYRAGKLSQPVGTLNDVIAHWLYHQTEGLDKSRVAYLKEFNRISHFLIDLKESFDLIDEIGQELQIIAHSKYETSKEEEEQEEQRQALAELWDDVENESEETAETPNRSIFDTMMQLMHKMEDCKNVCQTIEGILISEKDNNERIYFQSMYVWIAAKFNAFRDEFAAMAHLNKQDCSPA